MTLNEDELIYLFNALIPIKESLRTLYGMHDEEKSSVMPTIGDAMCIIDEASGKIKDKLKEMGCETMDVD